MINDRVDALRELMRENDIDFYIIPSEDFHQSEYVGEFFKAREYISGFSGSAGEVLLCADDALLWTDGRYFIQASHELEGSYFKLMKMDVEGYPSLYEYLENHIKEGDTLAFDGRVMSLSTGKTYEDLVSRKGASIVYDLDLIDEVWEDRPDISDKKAFDLDVNYAGESRESKLCRIREKMAAYGADILISQGLDDNCWILNIRGDDIAYSPLVLNNMIIYADGVDLYIDEAKLDDELKAALADAGVTLKAYNAIYEDVKNIGADQKVLLDPRKINYTLYENLAQGIKTIEKANPAILMKAIKNETELANFKKAHILDGVAFVKFLKWLEDNVGKTEITEMSASDKLLSFRAEAASFISESFAPIMGYAENAAIVHYESSEDTNKALEPRGLFLTDTGGNYYEGSTDITRTIALGELTEEEKHHFTLVLRAHINLARAKFIYGSSGYALDLHARNPLWEEGLDFKHGTGHGVGYLLNVHEGPAGFRYKINPAKNEEHPIEAGMVLSNEPGLYFEGKYGIRTENLMTPYFDSETEFGKFMKFDQLTLVPIDLKAINKDELTHAELRYLNDYHKLVFETLEGHLDDEHREWLRINTKNL